MGQIKNSICQINIIIIYFFMWELVIYNFMNFESGRYVYLFFIYS